MPPEEGSLGVVLIVHGFLGYKDYGMFPFLARSFCEAGFVAHRFNLSHSGMTNDVETFARPDLFERDTWNTQVNDIAQVMRSVDAGRLPGEGLPIILLGHSRGGVSVLLTAGRMSRDAESPRAAGVITLAAPDRCDRISDDARQSLMTRGFHEVVSNRTKQTLRVGRAWLDEQIDEPEDHDVLGLCAHVACPVLVAHGEDDSTVPVSCADSIAHACRNARLRKLEVANHVLNAPNPMGPEDAPSVPLAGFVRDSIAFAKSLG